MRFHRYVAIGDSFTEGVGDPDPARPNGLRGWADRVADVMAADSEDFSYANLAVRGRKLRAIMDDQVPPAVAMAPDLITCYAGANDILRPKVDIDALLATYETGVSLLSDTGAQVVLFTAYDPGVSALFRPIRGRMAIYNEGVREIADRHGAWIVDMWRMRDVPAYAIWAEDRMHLNATGHHYMARAVLSRLGVRHDLPEPTIAPPPERTAAETRREHIAWAREHAAPWVHRRLTGRSSGDLIAPKRPTLERWEPPQAP